MGHADAERASRRCVEVSVESGAGRPHISNGFPPTEPLLRAARLRCTSGERASQMFTIKMCHRSQMVT